MNIEKERERFEAWYRDAYGLSDAESAAAFTIDSAKNDYAVHNTRQRWRGWEGKANEMTEARARDLLNDMCADGRAVEESIEEGVWDYQSITRWDVLQLKALVWWMENKA